MKYQIQIGAKTIDLEIEDAGKAGTVLATVDEKKWPVSYQTLSANTLHLAVDGEAVRACLARKNGEKHIFINGRVYVVSEKDRQAGKSRSKKNWEDSPGEVTPPMPSVVVRILVEEGEWVSQGQGLVVVSAMKMETTLKAPMAGKVIKINTALQAKVMPGDRLVEIKEEARDDG
jgi:3-methylcrotonyl-CoA carboxylase alpha subunit